MNTSNKSKRFKVTFYNKGFGYECNVAAIDLEDAYEKAYIIND